jgi:nucleoside-diphosphate-sugar epimerase
MQTILGAGGAIGIELAKALTQYTDRIRLVSRNPVRINPSDELFQADLTKKEEVRKAVQGSSVVYLTVGFPYSAKVWGEVWPTTMRNVIDACKEHQAKLVFFDNIYMYDENHLDGMDEDTPINPPSKKGKIRAEIASMLMEEMKSGALTALIARAADFYGPGIKDKSVLTETVFNNLSKGKQAFWLGDANKTHSFTYTPDAGKATALLGNTPEAYNQVWHLPTASNPLNGKEWVEAIAAELGVAPKMMAVPKILVQLMGVFSPFMKEMGEMMYQYNKSYKFGSSKFEAHFNWQATPYHQGIREIVQRDYPK